MGRITDPLNTAGLTLGDLVTHLPDGMVAVDSRNIITHANPAFAALVNRDSSEEILGESIDQWLGESNSDLNALRTRLNDEGQVTDFPGQLLTSNNAEMQRTRRVLLSAKRLPGNYMELVLMIVRPVAA